ncbi:MAG: hypothetical protein NZM65_04625 [Flavobacteriales bacterium]|nr:hypothetical protein [Flavobacteriales bacterium]MDW8409955.1 hypothetical protein [Flavobacteriales bacterium]
MTSKIFFEGTPNNVPTYPWLPQAAVFFFSWLNPLHPHEIQNLKNFLSSFFPSWHSHGRPIQAIGLLSFRSILAVGVDETTEPISGCAKDTLYRNLQNWSSDQGLNLADRGWIPIISFEELRWARFDQVRQMDPNLPIVDLSCERWSQYVDTFAQPISRTRLRFLLKQPV